MKALVTGGFGFIGSFLSQELYKGGWNVRILDMQDKIKSNIEFNHDKLDYVDGDILDYATVSESLKDIDLIIHLAAKHRFFGISENEFYKVNVDGTKTILEAMSQNGINNIIFYSSVAVYGDQPVPTDEKTKPQPNTLYGISKLEAEKLISNWVSENSDRNALIIRPTVVFGPRNKGNIYRLIRQIDKWLYIPVGKGENIKSVAYVGNLVAATLFLINKGFRGIEFYNYADEPHMSFNEIVGLIYKFFERSAPKFTLPVMPVLYGLKPFDFFARLSGKNFPVSIAIRKMNKTTHHLANKIRRAGFHQIFSLEDGLKQMIEWYKGNGKMDKIQVKGIE